MRIQHNIMAMNAYRNYNTNTSALSKNLEKLSSGYKINRAGDDAAGLAISEKMRAQITGLNAAQKNVKDGISLVKTAEGAMQEIHDMLNRMDYLATQSANGTYDNEVDRANLQKEVASLKSEINRIADSANFNGIKLLDGSLATDVAGKLSTMTSGTAATDLLPEEGKVLGTDTVLHNKATDPIKAQFGVNLHNVSYNNNDVAGEMTIKFGTDEITISGGATKAEIDTGTVTAVPTKMDLGGVEYEVEGDTVADQLQSWVDQFNAETDYATVADAENFTAAVNAAGDGIVLTAKTAGNITPTLTGTTAIQAGADATVTAATATTGAATITGNLATATDIDWTDTNAMGSAGVAKVTGLKTITATLGGESFTIEVQAGAATAGSGKVQVTEGMSYDDLATAIQTELTALTTAKNAENTAANLQATTAGNVANTAYGITLTFAANTAVTGSTSDTYTANSITAGNEAKVGSYSLAGPTDPVGQMTIAGKSYTVSKPDTDLAGQLQEWANKFNTDENNADAANWTAEVNDAGDGIKFVAKAAGEKDTADTFITAAGGTLTNGTDSPFTATGANGEMTARDIVNAIVNGVGNANVKLNGAAITDINDITLNDGAHYKLEGNGYTLSFTQLADDTGTAVLDRTVEVLDRAGVKLEEGAKTQDVKGDYNVSTSFNKPETDETIDRLASTKFTLTADMVKDGGSLFIGGTSYQFTTDKANKDKEGFVYIGDVVDKKGVVDGVDDNGKAKLETVAERITVAAKDNKVWTVDYNKTELTFTETLDEDGVAYTRQDGAKYDFTKLEDIESSLGIRAPGKNGTALTLQIGDTSDEFNQMKVSVGDMHTSAMGIEDGEKISDVDISTQAGAAKAVDVIKSAINYVSSVRGDLGAIQNRLEHTQNNLSVMAENIQDAESTIRDTDVAEEMMSYVKNNILVQSAQAMLAQANQLPQGVLQLLG